METSKHRDFMLAALAQAWLGRGNCAPNPAVGAAAVFNNQIIAQGYHHGPGTPHAEIEVLTQIPPGLKNIKLYVTLEPCNHWGLTPPCVDQIVQYGVSEVIYAFKDPNPVVALNDTEHILRSYNIKTKFFPLVEITNFYQSYSFWHKTKKPFVTAKLAISLDGKIANPLGRPVQLSNQFCHKFTHQKRKTSDIILTTAKTIKNDDPALNVRLNNIIEKKYIAILDPRLEIDEARIYTTARHCLIYHNKSYSMQKSHDNCTYYSLSNQSELLNLNELLDHLGSLGFHDLWVEAGGVLFSKLHQLNLVQRTYLYITPKILGKNAIPAFLDNIFDKTNKIVWQVADDNAIACIDWVEN